MVAGDELTDTSKRPNLEEIATILGGEDITRGYVDGLPYLTPQDPVLNQAGGLEGYEALLKDDQVQATFSQRRNAVIARPWEVKPGGTKRQDKAAAQLVEETLKRLDWDNITDQMLFARFYGFGSAEVMWEIADSQVRLADIRVRDRRRFAFAPDRSLLLLTTNRPNGKRLPERKFWTASVGASHHDEPYGLGIAHAVYWPVWFKRNGAKFWALFLEKFASPTPAGTFPIGASEAERNKLLASVRAVAMGAGIILPEGVKIDLIEATRGGNVSYENWMKYWDEAIAKVILGQTMTTSDGSSYAQATVHYDVRQDLVKADADLICQSANSSWVRWLVDYNFPGAAYPQIWRELEDAEDVTSRATRDKTLFDMGFGLTDEAVTEFYGDHYQRIAPMPEDAPQEADAKPAPAQPPAPAPERQIGFRFSEVPEPAPPADALPITALTDALDRQADAPWQAILAHVEHIVNTAPDLPTLRDQLLASYSELPIEQLGKVMSLGQLTADLAGRYDVHRESAHA